MKLRLKMTEKPVSSLVMEFDDIIRCYNTLLDNTCEKEFLRYVANQEICRIKWLEADNESKRLRLSLDATTKDITVIDSKLSAARRWLDSEKQIRKKLEKEKSIYISQLNEVKEILFTDGRHRIPEETRERLSFLRNAGSALDTRSAFDRLNTIDELDSTVSLSNLSDTTCSRSDGDFVNPYTRDVFPGMKHSLPNEEYGCACPKRKRSSMLTPKKSEEIKMDANKDEQLVATTTVTVNYGGSAQAKSKISTYQSRMQTPLCEINGARTRYTEDNESEEVQTLEPKTVLKKTESVTPVVEMIKTRGHNFVSKNTYMPEHCAACDKKLSFGRKALKCTECNAFVHVECSEKLPLPCVQMGTPNKSGVMGYIHDYTPLLPPMIPALVIHCINEIEQRGLTEMGIYRVPGSDREVRTLKEKFLRCKGAPNLSEIDIHTVCGCLKDFLRTLQDSLIPRSQWKVFVEAIHQENKAELQTRLYQAISVLPQANRDTLAFLILHLQRVANSAPCKMPITNLAKVFGPTIVGCCNVENIDPYTETHYSNEVMEQLLLLQGEYWSSFISEPPPNMLKTPALIRNAPSTESLLRKTSRRILTTPRSKRYFDTPPSIQKRQ